MARLLDMEAAVEFMRSRLEQIMQTTAESSIASSVICSCDEIDNADLMNSLRKSKALALAHYRELEAMEGELSVYLGEHVVH